MKACRVPPPPAAVEEVLDLVGIPEPQRRAADFPHKFSGGMRQRVMVGHGRRMPAAA